MRYIVNIIQFSLLFSFGLTGGAVNAQTLMLTGENYSANIDVVDVTDLTFNVVESMTSTSDFDSVKGIFGMSLHPITGQMYVVYQPISATSANRRLGIFDQETAAIKDIGNCGNIIDIAFDSSGNLFGSTGNQAPDYSFVLIDLATAAPTFIFDYTPSSHGGGMAYNRFTDEIYYQNNVGTAFIDPGTFIETVGSPTDSPGETQAMIILTPTLGWQAFFGSLYVFNPQTEVFSFSGTSINGYHAFSFTNTPKPFISEGDSVTVTMSDNSNPTPFEQTLNAVDQQNDVLTWSLSTPASNGMAVASGLGNSLEVDYVPNPDYFGTDSFVVQVTDGTNTDTITVNVVIELDGEVPEGQTLSGEIILSCPQHSTLTLQSSELGFDFYLRDADSYEVIGLPHAGTGTALVFQTGLINETTTYDVFAANPSYALDFDGNDDFVRIPHDANLMFSDGITIEAWVYPTDITTHTYHDIYRKDNNADASGAEGRILLMFQDNGTHLSLGVQTTGSGYIELDVDINPLDYENQWSHILAFYDDATNAIRMYVNGIEIGSLGADGTIVNPSASKATDAIIGAYEHPTLGIVEHFDGKITSLRIWDKALTTQQEINQAKDNLFVGDEINLVAYYPFFENVGTQLTDVTSNANNGIVLGATWNAGTAGGFGAVVSNILRLVCTVYVDLNAAGADDGSSWVDAFDTIQEGVDASNESSEILVAEGTYMTIGEITINHALSIKGGYPSGGGIQGIEQHPTTIDAAVTNPVNLHRVIQANHLNGTLYIEGLMLQNGTVLPPEVGGAVNTSGDLELYYSSVYNNLADSGGGVYSINGDIKLVNSVLNDNISSHSGGGIYAENGQIIIIDSTVSENTVQPNQVSGATLYGAGLHSNTGNITVVNSTIRENQLTAQQWDLMGGGVSSIQGEIVLINSQIIDNKVSSDSSDVSGGGVFTQSGTIQVTNSLVYKNEAITMGGGTRFAEGGGLRASESSVGGFNIMLNNSAVIGNFISTGSEFNNFGAGVFGLSSVENSLLWDNTRFLGVSSEHDGGIILTASSLIKGLDLTADNGLDASDPGFAPLFVDEMNGEFSLLLGSPLIDAGDFNLLPVDDFDVDGDGDLLERIPLDLAGMTRELGIDVEIGPFEFQTEYLVGGILTGLLAGNEITLQNNSDELTLVDNGAFAFTVPVAVGVSYTVTVLAQPSSPIQPCSIINGSGAISNEDIIDVLVSCEAGNDLIFRDGF